MQEHNTAGNKPVQADEIEKQPANNEAVPHKHNPFEDKQDSLTKEEESIEQFKEAQTERD